MAETTAKLQVLVQLRDEASAAISRLGTQTQDLGGSFKFLSDNAGMVAGAMAAVSAAIGVGFGFGVQQIREANEGWLRASTILEGTGVALDAVRERAERMSETSIFEGHAIGEVYARNISLFGDTEKAVQKTKFAMDLAAFSGLELRDAQRLVGKASDENIMALKRLAEQHGIMVGDIDEHANKQEQFDLILGRVQAKVQGFDETLLKSDGIRQLTKNMNELAEVIGKVLLPVINSLIEQYILPAIKALRAWAEEHPKLTQATVLLTAALAVVLSVMSAIILALPALKVAWAALVAVWAVGQAIATAVAAGITAIGGAIVALVAVFGTLAYVWITRWQQIKDGFLQAYDIIMDKLAPLLNALNTAKNAVGGVFSAVGGAIGKVLPFASGGIVTGPTLGLIGESGPEAVIPLSRLGGMGGFGGGLTVQLNGDFYTDAETAERFGNEIARIIRNQIKL